MRLKTLIIGGFAALALGGGLAGTATASFADGPASPSASPAPSKSRPPVNAPMPAPSAAPRERCPKPRAGKNAPPRNCVSPARPAPALPGHPTYTG